MVILSLFSAIMPPLDWNKVMAVDPNELEEDDADAIYELLVEVGCSFLYKLFC
jgi:hypothetical protein